MMITKHLSALNGLAKVMYVLVEVMNNDMCDGEYNVISLLVRVGGFF